MIVEDHELSRIGLTFALKEAGLNITTSLESGEKAISHLESNPVDIILMDLEMPGIGGNAAIRAIKHHFPECKIIVLTMHSDTESVYAALAAGANAYCLKNISSERLIETIAMVAEGAIWLDPGISQMVMQSFSALGNNIQTHIGIPSAARQKYNINLTDRELEVLGWIVDGKNNKDIADSMSITIHTVKAHVCNIIQKLGVDDRTQAAIKALREEIIAPKPNSSLLSLL